MNSCRSTLIVDVYDVVPWQSPEGATFHDVNGASAKLSWLVVCILAAALVRPGLQISVVTTSLSTTTRK